MTNEEQQEMFEDYYNSGYPSYWRNKSKEREQSVSVNKGEIEEIKSNIRELKESVKNMETILTDFIKTREHK